MSSAPNAAAAPVSGSFPGSGQSVSGKKSKTSDKDVDLTHAPRGVWLVKIPNYVADRWEQCPDGAPVATLSIHKQPNRKPTVSLALAEEVVAARLDSGTTTTVSGEPDAASADAVAIGKKQGTTNQRIPTEHALMVSTPASQTLAVFSTTTQPPSEGEAAGEAKTKVCIEGRVVQRADCRPVNNKTYMSLKKEAILKAIEPKRKAIQLDRVAQSYKPISNHKANIEHDRKKKEEGKKSRDEKDIVMEKLFALFEKHQYYNIRDLVKETRQPITYLKEILKECCTYRVQNPHKNTWELKPEYRHYKAPEGEEGDKKKKESDESSEEEME